jgi:diacylglycerol kinase (ATP)
LDSQDKPVAAPVVDAATVSPFKGKTGLRRIVQALFNSLAGLADAWREESAFRQEVLLAVVLIPVASLVHVSRGERALLIATVLLVLIIELLNSSVEAAIDRISLDRHRLSRTAKDLGSAAVLIALILLGIVWALILLPA